MSSDPARVQEHDLDGLYRELYPSLVRFSQGIVGTRSDAEDAVQEAFAAAARAQPADDPRPWLFRITRNASIDLIRRRRPTVPLEAVAPAHQDTRTRSPEAAAELTERLDTLRIALAALPERGRTALLLRELAGLPYEEIGEVLETSEGNVKVLIFRARASLHAMAEAAELECDGVRVTLSAAADGEATRAERARAQLHTAHCRSCRRFAGSIGSNRAALAALAPIAIPHAAHVAGGSGFAGGLASAKAALAGVLVTTAAVSVTAGGVAIEHDSHSLAHRRTMAVARPGPTRPGGEGLEQAAEDGDRAGRRRPGHDRRRQAARPTARPELRQRDGDSAAPEPVDAVEQEGGNGSDAASAGR